MKNHLFGIINIGASAFRMIICEFHKGKPKEIEYLIKPLRLGLDTFSQGYISLEHVKQASNILQGFHRKLDEYKVDEYKALCTSGVREAGNKDFFTDYIKIHTNIELEILEPSEEVYIKYISAKNDVENFKEMEQEGVVFANISSGNVTLAITKCNMILYSGTLPYGSLRLRQMFAHVPFLKRYKAFDQYVDNMIKTVTSTLDPNEDIKYLVGGGSSINLMIKLFKPKGNSISKKDLLLLYKHIRSYSRAELIEELKLREDEASVIIPTLSTYIHLLEFTKSDYFKFSRADFPSTLTRFYTHNLKDIGFKKFLKATLLNIAKKYRVNIPHARRVAYFAGKLFKNLKELHSLGSKEYAILEAAALLHEVGYFIETDNLATNSYNIIKSLSLPGLKNKDILYIAYTAYNMSKYQENKNNNLLTNLPVKDKLLINKLASILRVADAFDAGKTEVINDFSVKILDNIIIINTQSIKEPFVELVAFENQKKLFAKTFGIPIDIRAKVSYE